MYDTDDQGKYHLGLEAGNGAGDHHGFQPGRNPGQGGDVHAEEGVHDDADDEGGDAQGGDQRGYVLETVHFAEQDAADDEQEPVAGIPHAHRKEQHEEDADVRRGIKFVVVRPPVHVGQHFELLDELVVLELDRRVVLRGGGFREPEGAGLVQFGGKRLIHGRGGKSFVDDQMVLCGPFSRRLGPVEIQFAFAGGVFGFQGRKMNLLVSERLLTPGKRGGHLINAAFGLFETCAWAGYLLEGQVGILAGGSRDDEIDFAVFAACDAGGVLLFPLGIVLLLRNEIVMETDAVVFQRTDLLRVDFAPGLSGGKSAFGLFLVCQQGGILLVPGPVPVLQQVNPAIQGFGLGEHFRRSFVNGFGGTGDVHHAQAGQLFQESFFLPVEEDEGVFGHFLDHSASSSSSAAWRVLTILEAALERFSSSSMYRLILRMASW